MLVTHNVFFGASEKKDLAHAATNRLIGASHTGKSSRTLASAKYDSPSKYSAQGGKWEAYIAANLHLYTVPLAIFLRRARELDFSASKFEPSLQTVRRVFRVFTPELVDCLNRLLQRNTPHLGEVVSTHIESLGPYAPPNAAQLSLASCQEDMTILLEEIHLQYTKKHHSPYLSFGNGATTQEKKISSLLERARVMVQLPEDYSLVAKPDTSNHADNTNDRQTMYSTGGLLTEDGFDRIKSGRTKCDPSDAVYQGDPMKSRLREGEVQLLYDIFVPWSESMSTKHLKVNLRCLAHVRSWALLSALLAIAWLLVQLFAPL